MNLEKLKGFIEFMNENNLCELEIEEKGERIRLKKNSPEQPVVISTPAPAANIKEEVKVEDKKTGLIEIKSPMVGTFYRAPSPGAKPYVETGDTIKAGDIICILEAMKLMNEIKAEVNGKIAKIAVENGEAVEFGQTLFIIEPL